MYYNATMSVYTNIWELYGLRYDPFNTSPLLVFGGEIPLSTFIGRDDELKRLNNNFRNTSSRIIVSGDIGVGKTSFVNYARSLAYRDGKFFTTIKEIAIQPDWSSTDFIINTLGAILTTINRKDIKIHDDTLKRLESLVSISEINNLNASVSIAGFGVGGGRPTTRNLPGKITMPLLQDLFEETVTQLKKQGFRELIIHYNNLELFESQDMVNLFQKLRDFVQTPNVHFIFVGGLIVPSVIQPISRVSSTFSDTPIILNNLKLEEIEAIIGRRVKYLTIKEFTSGVPIGKGVIKALYELYDGNLRHILNSLSTAFCEITSEVPVELTVSILKNSLKKVAEKRWLNQLTKLEKEALYAILQTDGVTNAVLSKKLKKQPQNISKITNKLIDLCAIRIKKKIGREKFFAAEPSTKWLLLKETEEEIKANEKMVIKETQVLLKDWS